jgi:MSHA pilin protein MshA
MKRTMQAGFTLIELVVVIVILGILAAVAVPQFTGVQNAANTAVGQAACGALQSSAVMLYASNRTANPVSLMISNTTVSTPGFFNGGCAGTTFTSNSIVTTCTPAIPATLCTGP